MSGMFSMSGAGLVVQVGREDIALLREQHEANVTVSLQRDSSHTRVILSLRDKIVI